MVFVDMPLIILIEVILLVFVLILASAWLVGQAEFKPLLMTVQTQLMLNPQDFSIIMKQVGSLLQKPGVLTSSFFLVVILIPLLEEMFKPLVLWFFVKRDWSPSEGFTAGLVCGAAFALVESVLSIVSVPQDTWLMTLVGRIGTGLLHTLTTGDDGLGTGLFVAGW